MEICQCDRQELRCSRDHPPLVGTREGWRWGGDPCGRPSRHLFLSSPFIIWERGYVGTRTGTLTRVPAPPPPLPRPYELARAALWYLLFIHFHRSPRLRLRSGLRA